MRDPYQVLGVPRDANADTIKSAFRRMAMQFHPDKQEPTATDAQKRMAKEKFQEAAVAYEILSDPDKRTKFDAGGMSGVPVDWFSGNVPNIVDAFRDIFGDMLGVPMRATPQQGYQAPIRPARGPDIHIDAELDFIEAFHGCVHEVSVQRGGVMQHIPVPIPAGVADQTIIRMQEQGGVSGNGGPMGNVFLTVRVRPHPKFQREGLDLHIEAEIPYAILVLGGEVDIETPTGVSILPVEAGHSLEQPIVVRNAGMPAVNSGKRGNLIVHPLLFIPKRLNQEQAVALRAFAELCGERPRRRR